MFTLQLESSTTESRQVYRRLRLHGLVLAVFVLASSFFSANSLADEVLLDESLTEMQTVGDFNVGTFATPVDISEQGILTDQGEIVAGKLVSFFKQHNIESVYELNLCLDIDSKDRSDQQLNSLQLTIGDSGSDQVYRLGDHILKLPGYEASDFKPEAGLSINLGFDFMQEFDENSTEKIRLTMDGDAGKQFRIAYLAPPNYFSINRFVFITAFASFWVFVFIVLFRVTTPKDRNLASPA